MSELKQQIVIENWIKPLKLVKYTNASLISYNEKTLVCTFNFPEKYSKNPFYIDGRKILETNEMYWGKRTFYSDR